MNEKNTGHIKLSDTLEKTEQYKVIELFKKLGYEYIKEEDFEKYREGHKNSALLRTVLREQLNKINKIVFKGKNYDFSLSNINSAVEDLDVKTSKGDKNVDELIYDTLMIGKAYPENVENTLENRTIKFIDFDNIENNKFHIVEEFTILGKHGNVRPDLILYVNGIPLVVIELKATHEHVDKAVEQIYRNNSNDYVPQLFKFATFVVASNGNQVKLGTTKTPISFFSEWKYKDETNEIHNYVKALHLGWEPKEHDYVFTSILRPERLLDFTKNFVIYDGNKKKIARYHQYYTVKAVIRHTENVDIKTGKRENATIWHTQGSGKSLTMVMIARYILNNFSKGRSKIIVVTDRKELDAQITHTFRSTDLIVKQATSGKHLLKLLKNNTISIVTTLLNKFKLPDEKGFVNDSENIIILVDECHRTQYGELASDMRRVFPNACLLGFSGTPLYQKNKTQKAFGVFIRNYNISDALEDGVIVKSIYNGIFIDQSISKSADSWFDDEFHEQSLEKQSTLIERFSSTNKVLSSLPRIQEVARNIYHHFKNNIWPYGFNAILTASSKLEAVRYYNFFNNSRYKTLDSETEFNVELCISPPDMREAEETIKESKHTEVTAFWRQMMDKYSNDANRYEDSIKKDFKNGKTHLMIVVQKLLTGFDVPSCQVLYIDRIIKGHELLQAMARVNRIKESKQYGIIQDYRGLILEVNKSLNIYSGKASLDMFDPEDLRDLVFNDGNLWEDLKQSFNELKSNFQDLKNNNDHNVCAKFLMANPDKYDKFKKDFRKFSNTLNTSLGIEGIHINYSVKDINFYKEQLKIYIKIYDTVKISTVDLSVSKEEEKVMQSLLDNHINAKKYELEIKNIDVQKLEETEYVLELMKDIEDPGIKTNALLKMLDLKIKLDVNDKVYRDSLCEELKKKFEELKSSFNLSNVFLNAKLDKFIKVETPKIFEKIANPDVSNIPEKIREKRDIIPIYRLLKEFLKTVENDDQDIAVTTLDICDIIKKLTKIEWQNNEQVINKMWTEVLMYLDKKYNNEPLNFSEIDETVNEIINAAKSLEI